MGSTVTTNKKVSGFVKPNGEIIYILFEETYEKNCYPHTPSWCCRAIGTFREVMLKVFRSAASCEGGGLQVRTGYTKPETYIQRWRDAFAKPVTMPNMGIELEVRGDSWSSVIPESKADFVFGVLTKLGRDDLVTRLKAGPVSLTLYENVDVFIAIYGNDGQLPPWKVFDAHYTVGFLDERLIPAKTTGSLCIPSVKAFKIDKENVLLRSDDGKWHNAGWQYSAVGKFIHTTALDAELRRTGAAASTIASFRASCALAKELPSSTKIFVEVDKSSESYRRDNAAKLAVMLKLCEDKDSAPRQFEVTFDQVVKAGCEYNLTILDNDQVTWTVPDQETPAQGGNVSLSHQPANQPSLF